MSHELWRIGVVLVAAATTCSSSGDGLINGDFEDGLTGWTVEGEVGIATAEGNNYALFQENLLGGVSRIFQVFDLPSRPGEISFRYNLSWVEFPREPQGGDEQQDASDPHTWTAEPDVAHYFPWQSAVAADWVDPVPPPDSFSVFLLDPNTMERLIPPLGEPPPVFQYFFYADTNGTVDYNADYVAVSAPDPFDVVTVTVDVSSLASGQSVRLEFGLAGFANQIMTFAALDDISCEEGPPPNQEGNGAPAVSGIGQVIMTLLLLGGGTLVFGRRRLAGAEHR